MKVMFSVFFRNLLRGSRLPAWYVAICLSTTVIQAAPLMEEGFNYSPGSALAANPPWAGSAAPSVSIVSGSLTQTNLRATVPLGNMLQISGGTSAAVYRNFTGTPVTAGVVYLAALIRCVQAPTNTQFIAGLLSSGSTSHNSGSDALDLSVTAVTNGNAFSFRLTSSGSDPATWRQDLPTNSTHLIVLKYDFGSSQAMMYVDPIPGGPEPASPTLSTQTSDDGGTGASDVQVLLFGSASSPGQGVFQLDTLRAGTNWADVVLAPAPLSLDGPLNQAVCFGDSATFSVIPTGTPPFAYQWRTNGDVLAGATNSAYTLLNPSGADALNHYDVVVTDAFGSITSEVASLFFTTNAASIVTPPISQLVTPGVTNVTFNVVAAGDAPISYQWRTNGIAIGGATNANYTLSDPYLTNGPVAVDVVVSNPCGTVTSTPTVGIYYPTVFDFAYDAGPGFFGGENIILTNTSGMSLYAWSSPDLSVSVTNWTLEGPMTETPLGVTGTSRYGITLNPTASPVYYFFAEANTGPYTPTEPLTWLTTSDFASFTMICSNASMSADGFFNQSMFSTAYDAGPGFFGGENIILTNASGMSYFVWSSPNPTVSVNQWTLEGPMSEVPLGTTGKSYYGITLNPVTSPLYFICAPANTAPYTAAEALGWLTTADFVSFTLITTNASISSLGVFSFESPPVIVVPPASQTVLQGGTASFNVTATGSGLSYQWFFNNMTIPTATGSVFSLTNISSGAGGSYGVVVTDSAGSVTSAPAILTVNAPPAARLISPGHGTVQLSANCAPRITYIVQCTTNILNPIWIPILTNNSGSNGVVNFQGTITGSASMYYRLSFP